MAQVAIIGAGIAGMACAARLAALGHRVTVMEQAHRAGGICAGRSWQGHTFDSGPDSVTMLAGWRDLFLSTGRPLEDSVTVLDAPLAGSYRFPDGTVLDLPGAGVARTQAAVRDALGVAAAQEWANYLAAASRIWAQVRAGLTDAGARPARIRLPRRLVSDRRLALLLTRRRAGWGEPTGLGLSPLLPYLEAAFGVQHIKGGVHALAGALHQRCEQLGVQFHWGAKVQIAPRADVTIWSRSTPRTRAVAWQQHAAVPASLTPPGHWVEWLDHRGGYLRVCAPDDESMHPVGSRGWTVRSNQPVPLDVLASVGLDLRPQATWQSDPYPLLAAASGRRPRWARFSLDSAGPGLPVVVLTAQRVATAVGPA